MDEEHLTALLTFMRHGEKDADGALTSSGFRQAGQAGLKGTSLHGDILLFHSGVGRVRDTIRTMASHLDLDRATELSLDEGRHIVDYVAPSLHFLHNPSNKGSYHEVWESAEHSADASNQRMSQFLSLDRQSPEEHVWLSPREMAKNIAVMIGIQVRFANMTDFSTRVNFVNGSHEPVLMAFIHYFLHDFAPGDANTVERVGGTINYAEEFEIAVLHRSARDFRVEFRFRDIKKDVDLVRLREFGYSD